MLCLDQYPRTPSELRAALESRQLEQQHLATLVGVSERTIRRWCDCRAGDRPLRPTWRALVAMGLQAFDAMPRPEPEPPKEHAPDQPASPCPPSPSADLATIPAASPAPAAPPPPRNRKRRYIPSNPTAPIKPIYKPG